MNILAPTNYKELLASCQSASVLTYFRDTKSCLLMIDDKPNDRRTAISFEANYRKAGMVEIKTLCGFDVGKNIWKEYCRPQGEIEFQNRRGEKEFLAWIREQALKQDQYTPAPTILTVYKTA